MIQLNPNFKLNGHPQDRDGLYSNAYSFIKEGENWEKDIGEFLLDWLSPSETITVHTSGSTGTPKAIKLRKEHMRNSAIATGDFLYLHSGTLTLFSMPARYIAGKMMLVRAMVLGWEIDITQPSSTPFHRVSKRYDIAACTPHQVLSSLEHIHKTRKCIIGGGPITQELLQQLQGKHTQAYHSYGMTETCSHVAMREVHPRYEEAYTAMPDVKFSKTEEDCLIIDAPRVADEVLHTTDVIDLLTDTQFKWLGRSDNIINSGGVKISPEIIEQKLSAHISVPFFVTGLPHDKLGEQVVLVIESDVVIDLNYEGLEGYEKPKQVFTIPKFKRSPTDKILRRETLDAAK